MRITELLPGHVFVFGSNEAGIHGAGAAADAQQFFGARTGVGVGFYGRSYAIPTKDEYIKTLPLHSIAKYVEVFKDFAIRNPKNVFHVTPIGCGLAGYTPTDIAPFFKDSPWNVILPEEFLKELSK